MQSLSSEHLRLCKVKDISELSVCIVTPDIMGPIKNGGVGTVFYALAKILAKEGANVTVLFALGEKSEEKTFDYWVQHYRKEKIDLVPLSEPKIKNDSAPMPFHDAYCVYEWLKYKKFDAIHFCDWRGLGFYCVQAKKMSIAFQETTLVTNCHGPTLWNWRGNKQIPDNPAAYTYNYIERVSVEMSDVVVCSSTYIADWIRENGWKLPCERTFIQPNVYINNSVNKSIKKDIPVKIREIVYCGRLELRKGLHIFIDSINRIGEEKFDEITFIGKPVKRKDFDSIQYINSNLKITNKKVNFYTDFDVERLVEYMGGEGRIAILPSICDNSPMIINDFLCHRIPFLASNVGGIPEMIADADKDKVLFSPIPSMVAMKIKAALNSNIYIPGEKYNITDNNADWVRWHEVVPYYNVKSIDERKRNHVEAGYKLTVCLTHHDRPIELTAAIKSLEDQTFSEFTVIVVDDGSVTDEALYFLEVIEPRLKANGWRLIRQPNKYVGAARNLAAKCAETKYLVFMDDDNLAKPNELEIMYRAAVSSNADVLTCFADVFDDQLQVRNSIPLRRLLFGGGVLGSGLWVNMLGDANCIVKTSVFNALNGFHETFGVGLEDYHFFVRAALEGYQVNVIPEALYWYRISKNRIQAKHYKTDEATLMIADEYARLLPHRTRDIILSALTRSKLISEQVTINRGGQLQGIDGRNKPIWAKKIYWFEKRGVSRIIGFQNKIFNGFINIQMRVFLYLWNLVKKLRSNLSNGG